MYVDYCRYKKLTEKANNKIGISVLNKIYCGPEHYYIYALA